MPQSISPSDAPSHETFMRAAIASAYEGIASHHGGPFGACITHQGRIVALAHNTVLSEHDPTCHAEMNAIRLACRTLNTHLLHHTTLYTTAEPCPMCLSAIYWARIPEVHVGTSILCAAKYGFDDANFYSELLQPQHLRSIRFHSDLLSEDCEKVFQQWKKLNSDIY